MNKTEKVVFDRAWKRLKKRRYLIAYDAFVDGWSAHKYALVAYQRKLKKKDSA